MREAGEVPPQVSDMEQAGNKINRMRSDAPLD